MKAKFLYIIVLSILCAGLIGFKIFHPQSGPHGGIVKPAEEYYIELKESYPNLYAFLLDKNLRAIGNKGISCNARFILLDSTLYNVQLRPFWEDSFKINISSLKYLSCRIYFNQQGKTVSAQFENENSLVNK